MHVYTSVLQCWQPNWPFARQVQSQTRNIANKPQLLVLKGDGESIYVTVGNSKQAVHSRICSQHPLQVPLYLPPNILPLPPFKKHVSTHACVHTCTSQYYTSIISFPLSLSFPSLTKSVT